MIERGYGLLKGIEFTLNMLYEKNNDMDTIFPNQQKYFSNKLGNIYKTNFQDFKLSIKKTSDPIKIKEHIHENYVGIKHINDLSKDIPNFCYTFGIYKNSKNETCLINEYIEGITFDSYIKSKKI